MVKKTTLNPREHSKVTCYLLHARMNHKLCNKTHLKSCIRKEWGKGEGACEGLSGRTVSRQGVGQVCLRLKVAQHVHVGAYGAMPRMHIDYVATQLMCKDYIRPWDDRAFCLNADG